jgi:hypothetical protein
MKYICHICNYNTTSASNFSRHNETKQHLLKSANAETEADKEKKEYLIEIKRMQLVIDKMQLEIDKNAIINEQSRLLIIKLTDELADERKQNKNLQANIITDLKDDKQHYKSIVSTVNANNSQSMSTINFLTTHRNSAPPLQELTDTTAKLCIEYNNNDLINRCISFQKKNELHSFIGNIIVGCYKTEDPKDQSIWNSDVSRLTFIIRDTVKDINIGINKKGVKHTKYIDKWIPDKKGVKVNKRVITPILKFLRNTLDSYSITHAKAISTFITTDPFKYAEELEKIGYANKIISTIASGKLAKRISVHIGAHFQLDNKEIIANDDNDQSDSDDSNKSELSLNNSDSESESEDEFINSYKKSKIVNKKYQTIIIIILTHML